MRLHHWSVFIMSFNSLWKQIKSPLLLLHVSDVKADSVLQSVPWSLINHHRSVEEGQNVSLQCKATGLPAPRVAWRKAFSKLPVKRSSIVSGNLSIRSITKTDSGTYACSAKNLLGDDSAVAVVMVIERLQLILIPLNKVTVSESCKETLHCTAQGSTEIICKQMPQNHVVYPNGTLLLTNVSPNNAGSYTCIAKNALRSIEASSVVEVPKRKPTSCSDLKSSCKEKTSGNYILDPDGKGAVAPFSVYYDMSEKGGVGVTAISHNSESRTHVNSVFPGCEPQGCYSKDVTYTGVSTSQLAALTRVSQNCKQFIKFECNSDIAFIEDSYAWWVSRDGSRMNYWGGASGRNHMCACWITNSCSNRGQKFNCYNDGSGWREDSGLLTDKSTLPVTQIRLGDLDNSHIRKTEMLWKGLVNLLR